jgi:hypothetical protein
MTIYLSAALRHILALIDGEDIAEDSGFRHEAHAAACLGILLDAKETGNLIDDRPQKGCAGRLIAEMTTTKQLFPPCAECGSTAPLHKAGCRCPSSTQSSLDRGCCGTRADMPHMPWCQTRK